MKNNILFFILLFLLPFVSWSQDYFLVHVTGQIERKGKTLQVGDALLQNDVLSFANKKTWAIFVNQSGQQFFVQPQTDSMQTIGFILQAIEKTEYPITRNSDAPVENLLAYFSGSQFVFIGDDFYLAIDPKKYLLNDRLFLLYRYEYNSRIITHKIPHNKQVIHFNKSFLYEYKGDSIPYVQASNTELSYFNSNTNLPSYAAGLRPIWLNEMELKRELSVLQKVHSSKKTPKAELKKIFLQYVLDIYGKTDEVIFSDWVDRNMFGK